MQDASKISWRTGYSKIAYREQGLNSRGQVVADTAFLYWETPPPVTIKVDSTKKDTTSKKPETEIYIDTIWAIVDGVRSDPIIIEIKNILPRISSLSIGGLSQPGDSVLVIAAHPGDRLEIEMRFEKAFNKGNSPRVHMPNIFGPNMRLKLQSDSLYSWEWLVPNEIINNDTAHLRIMDSGGEGERIYNIHLISYADYGSVWVASETEIAKYSSNGLRVLRIQDTSSFGFISDIAVNSKENGRLFVVDRYKNTFAVYNTYGKLLHKNSTLLQNPTSIAVDIDGIYIWAADNRVVEGNSTLQAFDFIDGTLKPVASLKFNDLPGAIGGLSPDQFERNRVWFAIPEKDTVGFISYSNAGNEVKYIEPKNGWNRPSMVSHDPNNGLAWVADSSRIVAINYTGKEMAIIEGFGFVSTVSASGGGVWVSDILNGKIYRFEGPFNGMPRDLALTVTDKKIEVGGFLQPAFVSAYVAGGSAWVMDKGKGNAVLLSKSGETQASGIGLVPNIGKAIQKVE
jgi:hypothetical protein